MGRSIVSGGGAGASGKPPAFLPEYLYPVGFFANYGPKGVQANNKRSARQCEPLVVCPEESRLCFLADYGPKGVQGASGKPPALHR